MTNKVTVSKAQRGTGWSIMQLLYFRARGPGEWDMSQLTPAGLQPALCCCCHCSDSVSRHGLPLPCMHQSQRNTEYWLGMNLLILLWKVLTTMLINMSVYRHIEDSERGLGGCAEHFPQWLLFPLIGGTSLKDNSHFQQAFQSLGVFLIPIIIHWLQMDWIG